MIDPDIWAGISGSHASHGASKLSPPIGFDPGRKSLVNRIIAMGEQAKRLNEESKHDPRRDS